MPKQPLACSNPASATRNIKGLRIGSVIYWGGTSDSLDARPDTLAELFAFENWGEYKIIGQTKTAWIAKHIPSKEYKHPYPENNFKVVQKDTCSSNKESCTNPSGVLTQWFYSKAEKQILSDRYKKFGLDLDDQNAMFKVKDLRLPETIKTWPLFNSRVAFAYCNPSAPMQPYYITRPKF